MKKITGILLAAVCLLQPFAAVHADICIRADLDGGLKITDFSDENAERGVGIMPYGSDINSEKTQTEIFDDMLYINQMGIGEKSVTLFPELTENAVYRAAVRSENAGAAQTCDFEWISPQTVAGTFYPSLNAQNMRQMITSEYGLKILDLYCGDVSGLSAEGKAALAAYLAGAQTLGAADFIKKCTRAAAALSICDISDGDISAAANPVDEKLARLCDDLEISALPEYLSYRIRDNRFKLNLSKRINGSRSRAAADFEDYFTEQFYLARIETALNYSQINPVLTAMSQKCGLNLSQYNLLTDKKNADESLVGKNFETTKALEEYINGFTNPASPTAPGGGISAGGTGGGGTGGGGAKISVGALPQLSPEPSDNRFGDVNSSHWAIDAINVLSERGVLSGYGNGDFCPDNSVTRAEFLTMLLRTFGLADSAADGGFSDTPEDAWYYSYAASGKKYGITGGYEDGSFRADNRVSRQEAACMLVNAADVKAIPLMSVRGFEDFSDSADIAAYAEENVQRLFCAGIISGYENGRFLPQKELSRAEAAQMIFLLLKISA